MDIWIGSLFACTAAFAFLLTPATIVLARRIGACDIPDARKIHDHAIPRLGGVAIFSSITLAAGTLFLLERAGVASAGGDYSHLALIFFPSLLMFGLGVTDDIASLRAGPKFAAQICIATITYVLGIRIDALAVPFEPGYVELGWLSYPVTVFWIAGVTNAFNLIDGLDGLASGVGIIASLTIALILMAHGEPGGAIPAVMLAGALCGFLWHNYHPAKIFLGDSGSLFVGFSLAVLSIQSSTKGSAAVAMSVPILALGVPILDTGVAMLRRLLGSFTPSAAEQLPLLGKLGLMFRPDRRHIHHQLIALGVSHRNAVLVLYGVSAALGVAAVLMTVTGSTGAFLIVVGAAAAAVAGIRRLHYDEMAFLRNGMLLPLYDWPIFRRSLIRCTIDLACSALAFYLALAITGVSDPSVAVLSAIPVAAGVQVCVLAASGLYRTSFRYSGIAEVFTLINSAGLSVLSVALLLLLMPHLSQVLATPFLITDFYILVTFVGLTRISFRALFDLSRREVKRGTRILIYGADEDGVLMLQQILNDDSLDLQPVGFLDDNPLLTGKNVSGYKVFGGHWNLQRLLQKYEIGQVLISTRNIHPVILARIGRIADDLGVELKRPRVFLAEVPRTSRRRAAIVTDDPGPLHVMDQPASSPAGRRE